MTQPVVLLSVPALREQDVDSMPNLSRLAGNGDRARLSPGFPAVTCPVQANMTTGVLPNRHSVVANGFFYRDRGEFEMWTAWNDCILAPQIWDTLHERRPGTTSAVWFPLHSKGCGADYLCTPAPLHNPDGTESMWCHTRPEDLYPRLIEQLDHFPLHHFWGPLANIASSEWIADSATLTAKQHRPDFFYIYLPQLDYAAQRVGPNDPLAALAVAQLDELLGRLFEGFRKAYESEPLWIVASEYAIQPVDHVVYPNRVLREAGLLKIMDNTDRGEILDVVESPAWAMADHQHAHVFVRNADPTVIDRVASLFKNHTGIAKVLAGSDRERYGLDHPRSGEVVLVSEPNSWQAYYYWLDDARAPDFAYHVDIHRKPGYDPIEMHLDIANPRVPLDATLAKGSHGAPVLGAAQHGVILASQPGMFKSQGLADTDVHDLVLCQFGI